jgi:hypothetical protein
MIQTKEFALEKNEYLKILVYTRFRKLWWLYGGGLAISFYHMPDFGNNDTATFWTIYGFGLPLIVLLQLWRWVNAKDNRNLFRPRELRFSTDKIVIVTRSDSVFQTPTTSEIAHDAVVKREEVLDYYLLYVAKAHFVVVPKNHFFTADDRAMFAKMYHFAS